MRTSRGRGRGRGIQEGGEAADAVSGPLLALDRRLARIEQAIGEVRDVLLGRAVEQEWYSSADLAEAMEVSVYTVTERWCNQGRIHAEKDPSSGKWKIPASEYRRLLAGGSLRRPTKE
jgi:hypothetical protein